MAQIMRESVTVDFGRPNPVAGPQDNIGYVRPDFAKFTGTTGPRQGGNTEVGPGNNVLLDSLGGQLRRTGETLVNTASEEAYLQGQAAAAAGKSQEELDSNILTRRWSTAGWADTKSRLSVADAEAQTAQDMKKLREQDPSKMAEYLQQRRESLMPLMKNMSMEARKGMMAQMALSDQHAIAKHGTEHAKFIIDQNVKSVSSSWSVAQDAMNASKNDPGAYGKAVDNAMANLWGNVVQNPNLPAENKAKLLEEAALLALENNNEQLYEKMRDTKDSQGNTLLTGLPFDSQSKLAKAYQASKKDTATMRNTAYNTQMGLYQSKLDDPLSAPVSWDDHQAFVGQGIQLGVITGEKQAALAKAWADGNAKKQAANSLASAYAAGDINSMFALGKTEEEGSEAFLAAFARKGGTPGDAAAALAQIGATTGQSSAFKKVGVLMRSSISMIGTSDKIDPGQLAGVNSVLGVIDSAEKRGNLAAKTAFLGSFDDDTQARMLTYWDGLKAGKAPAAAAAEAMTRQTENDTLTKADKAALGQGHAKENIDLVNSITPKGLFAQAWEKVVPDAFRFKDNINTDKLRADRNGIIGWRDNLEVVEEAQAKGKVALLQEMNDISRSHPYMGADARKTMALAKVAGRTITTEGGPVILPQGQTVSSYFGTEQSISADVVSSALNNMHKPGKGNRVIYSVAADGRMQWLEKNDKGELVSPGGTFNPRDVAGAIRAEQDRRTEKFIQTDGEGRRVNGPDGSSVRFNGDNTLGVGTNVMFQVREDLVKHEGVRNKPYEDASGKIVNGKKVMTVGVGVSSHNPYYPPVQEDGTVLPSDINRSFMQASNAALVKANEYFQDLPKDRQTTYATRLLTSLTYQGGSVNDALAKALAGDDRAKAEKLLHASPQYKMSHDARRRFYDQMFNGMMPYNQNF
ncbi:internal virion lysozyme motif protein [Variovorax phage VAC_51]|uniref:Internal virion lysozyme motif protein n=1 Tax=Variovorax phage VAC_51 TaxID=2985242 RepID=A0A9N6ZG72_9CAUD|nr:internal virion lysozyme motif protein [Variovorax phage VAC_51]